MHRRVGNKSRRGVAATELALLVPFLGFLLVVAIDYCRVFHLTQTLDASAQNAALYAAGASNPNPGAYASVIAAAQQAALDEGSRLSPPLTSAGVSVTVTGNTATATITYTFKTITHIPGFPTTMTVQRTVSVPVLPTNPGYAYTTSGSNSGGGGGSDDDDDHCGSGRGCNNGGPPCDDDD